MAGARRSRTWSKAEPPGEADQVSTAPCSEAQPRRSFGAAKSKLRTVIAPVLAVVVAVVLAAVLLAGGPSSDDGRDEATTTTTEPPPVAVESDAPAYATLAELVAASDLVVRATVTSVEPGRVFGDPGEDGAIESRLVGVQVTEVWHGAEPPAEFLVEEEGWLLDGSPLVVDGLGPSEVGTDVVWFLVDPTNTEPAPFVTVNAQGRYTVGGDTLVGAAGDDPLVARVEALTPAQLEAQVRAAG